MKYDEISDSIYRKEAQRSFAEMEKKYETEKQNLEIGQLKLDKIEQDATIRKQRSVRNISLLGFLFAVIIGFLFYRLFKARKKADEEKEALLKEIHHRVKNNLQIISSLLSIQTDNLEDTKVIDAVQESQSRVKAMALIHQLLYQDKDLAHINFGTYLPQLVNALSSIFKKEGLKVIQDIDVKDMAFDIDTAIPLGLIVNELVANAFKYAYNGDAEGKLTIMIDTIKNKEYLLTVADNGPGLPENTNIQELSSMGLRLVTILTNQLDGTFSYTYNKGSVFTVKFSDTT
jgi:two-component sensor histidine kinase